MSQSLQLSDQSIVVHPIIVGCNPPILVFRFRLDGGTLMKGRNGKDIEFKVEFLPSEWESSKHLFWQMFPVREDKTLSEHQLSISGHPDEGILVIPFDWATKHLKLEGLKMVMFKVTDPKRLAELERKRDLLSGFGVIKYERDPYVIKLAVRLVDASADNAPVCTPFYTDSIRDQKNHGAPELADVEHDADKCKLIILLKGACKAVEFIKLSNEVGVIVQLPVTNEHWVNDKAIVIDYNWARQNLMRGESQDVYVKAVTKEYLESNTLMFHYKASA